MGAIQVLKVSTKSNVNAVAKAIVNYAKNDGTVYVDCIGVHPNYNAVKAIIDAGEILKKEGYSMGLRPLYVDVLVDNNEEMSNKTAIRWIIKAKKKQK